MAWNDPFLTLVDATVEELGVFLQNKGELAPHEITRTQEVCRNFCNFLCKDIHKATQKDYAVYLQLHAMTPEDEDDYAIMLSLIRQYCGQNMAEQENARKQAKRRAMTNNISLSEQELKDMFTMAEDSQSARPQSRHRKATNAVELTEQELHGLFMTGLENGEDTKRPQRRSAPASAQRIMTPQAASQSELELTSKATPQKPLKSIPDTSPIKKDYSMDVLEKEIARECAQSSQANRYSDLLNNDADAQSLEFDQKMRKALDDATPSKSAECSEPPGGKGAGVKNYSDIFNAAAGQEDSYNPNVYHINPNKSLAIPFENNAPTKAVKEILPNAGLVRDIEGVDYNFSHQSIKKMRDFEKKRSKEAIESIDTNPIDETLVKGFTPYLFDNKYMIDMPLPRAADMAACKPSIVTRYLIPCAPATILLSSAVLFFTFSPPTGALLAISALIAAAFALPSVLPASQQTPQATISAYIRAKNGRIYGKGQSLIAVHKSVADDELDLRALWRPEPSWPKALACRFKTPEVPKLRNVTGTDAQNAHLFIHELEGAYWLLPMIRIEDRWYITNPEMKVRDAKRP